MKLILCDEHRLFLDALSQVLISRGHQVVAAVTTREECIAAVLENEADICVLDLSFDGERSWERTISLITQLRQQSNGTKIVALSGTQSRLKSREAVRAGVSSVAFKTESSKRIIEVLERTLAGETVADPERIAVHATPHAADEWPSYLTKFLTAREKHVLELLVRGHSTTVLAREMAISYPTARTHIQSILIKLGVHSKVEAVAFAVRHALVPDSGGRRSDDKVLDR